MIKAYVLKNRIFCQGVEGGENDSTILNLSLTFTLSQQNYQNGINKISQ